MKAKKRHGFGVSISLDGVYKGEWKNDQPDGQGTFWNNEGNIYDGKWVNGQMDGFGKFVQVDGSVYNGQWVDHLKHGEG